MSTATDAQACCKDDSANPNISKVNKEMDQKSKERMMKVRFALGLISLIVGFLASNLALFRWVEQASFHHLLGEYSRYLCAYGGFSAMILGAMLVNDYISHKGALKSRRSLEKYSLAKIKGNHVPKRITSKSMFGNFRKIIVSMAPVFFLTLLPIVSSTISYVAMIRITVKFAPVYYLHRTIIPSVSPAGRLMDTNKPLPSQSEILYKLPRGEMAYFYSPMLSEMSLPSGTWLLYLWASTASIGRVSRLTVQIHLVSSDGTIVKALIGSLTSITIDYGYSERVIAISGNYVNISRNDRIRLTLHAQDGSGNDSKGLNFYYDGYGVYQTPHHETRLEPP